ncbi:MAG: Gfo/Idh/MocA family oxidoreductase [Oscillospiraceae bacterium]|nr:Gfo/Idh/MocA family oxidoreductase [Oscillospiraceae bacterium]
MRILFIGLGSIGKRHLKNITSLFTQTGVDFTVDTLRVMGRTLEADVRQLVTREFNDIEQLCDEYDIVFITNPSCLHYETLKAVVPFTKAVFIEKPVFIDPTVNLELLKLKQDALYYVACPLRWSPVVQRIGEIVADNRVIASRVICSSYLPDWRKNSDFRNSYSANRSLGGGVRLDLIHELDYILQLFGNPMSVISVDSDSNFLEISSEEVCCYILKYIDLIVSLHLDYIGRTSRREIEIFTEHDIIIGDIINNRVSFLKSQNTEVFEPIDIHQAEMRYFLRLIEKQVANINDIENAVNTLRYALERRGVDG